MQRLKQLFKKEEEKELKEVTESEELRRYFMQFGLVAAKEAKRPEKVSAAIERIASRTIGAAARPDRHQARMIANALFSGVIKRSPEAFAPVKAAVDSSGMKMLPASYASLIMGGSLIGAALGLVFSVFYALALAPNIMMAVLGIFLFPFVGLVGTFALMYAYPFYRRNQRRIDIDTNLPFAINQMSAVAASGVPPDRMFELLVEFKEYGTVSEEAENIVKRVKGLGEDITVAIRAVAAKTPSISLKEFLYGVLSIIEGGGDLRGYLREMASISLFNYKLARKRYLETLSTYADIYTAILIAAPLFLVATLAIINILPGAAIAGLDVNTVMTLGTYVGIPLVNVIFLIFLTLTQPKL